MQHTRPQNWGPPLKRFGDVATRVTPEVRRATARELGVFYRRTRFGLYVLAVLAFAFIALHMRLGFAHDHHAWADARLDVTSKLVLGGYLAWTGLVQLRIIRLL